MKFRIIADAKFEADNITDAFEKLAAHFASMDNIDADDQLIESGRIEIAPAASPSLGMEIVDIMNRPNLCTGDMIRHGDKLLSIIGVVSARHFLSFRRGDGLILLLSSDMPVQSQDGTHVAEE